MILEVAKLRTFGPAEIAPSNPPSAKPRHHCFDAGVPRARSPSLSRSRESISLARAMADFGRSHGWIFAAHPRINSGKICFITSMSRSPSSSTMNRSISIRRKKPWNKRIQEVKRDIYSCVQPERTPLLSPLNNRIRRCSLPASSTTGHGDNAPMATPTKIRAGGQSKRGSKSPPAQINDTLPFSGRIMSSATGSRDSSPTHSSPIASAAKSLERSSRSSSASVHGP